MSGFRDMLHETDGGNIHDVACGDGHFMEIHLENLRIDVLKQRFVGVGLEKPPQLVLPGYKQ
jgi:hypothetical protein